MLGYAENWIYAPAVQKEREIIEKTDAQILWMLGGESHSGSHSPVYGIWRHAGGGSLVGKGCHPLSACLYLKQVEGRARHGRPIRPATVSCRMHEITRLPGYRDRGFLRTDYDDVEDYSQLHVTFDDGTVADVFATELVLGGVHNWLEVFANNHRTTCRLNPVNLLDTYNPAAAQFKDVYVVEKIGTKEGWSHPAADEEWQQGFYGEVQDFLECCASGRRAAVGRDSSPTIPSPRSTRATCRPSAAGRRRRSRSHRSPSWSKVRSMLPRGPKGHVLLGSLPEFRRDVLGFLAACARDYGDVVPIRVAAPAAPAAEPSRAHRGGAHRARPAHHQDRPAADAADGARRRPAARARATPGCASAGSSQPAFHRQRIAAYGEVMAAFAERGHGGWKDGETRDVHAEMMALTQAIVAKTLFDADVSGRRPRRRPGACTCSWRTSARACGSLSALPACVPTPAQPAARAGRSEHLDRLVYRIIARAGAERRGPRRPALDAAARRRTPTTAAA